jgi:Ran GTPase-activating protein (RanGAP) involved in mRNA processing and transport
MGIFVDAFSQFCEGLAENRVLEFLDLQNNQLPPECGQYLSDAIKLNTSLKTLGQFYK